jgi:hypothetical protein
MAELLVKANKHWMDDLKQEDLDKMTKEQLQSYNARSQIGDIIVVRPDGWQWGKEECPPNFVVVKLPGVKEEDVKHYEQPLMDTTDPKNTIMLKVRKYATTPTIVDSCKVELSGTKEVVKATFDSALVTKTAVTAEIK